MVQIQLSAKLKNSLRIAFQLNVTLQNVKPGNPVSQTIIGPNFSPTDI